MCQQGKHTAENPPLLPAELSEQEPVMQVMNPDKDITDYMKLETAKKYKKVRSSAKDQVDEKLLESFLEQVLAQGYVVIPDLIDTHTLAEIKAELTPLLSNTGRNFFEGELTQRIYSVMAKTFVCNGLVDHPTILALLDCLFNPGYLLSQLQVINLLPGEKQQPIHHDDAFYAIPRPRQPLGAATIWAIDDFTTENGGTVILPGSHTWGEGQPDAEQRKLQKNCVMKAGSVVFFLGTLWPWWRGKQIGYVTAGSDGPILRGLLPLTRKFQPLYSTRTGCPVLGRDSAVTRLLSVWSFHGHGERQTPQKVAGKIPKMMAPTTLNKMCQGKLPGLLGIKVTAVGDKEVRTEMEITEANLAPNGYLHAGSVVSLADTSCGNGCIANLPEGASGFTTIELKSNHLGTARSGTIECVATPVHKGRTTQVWDAVVTSKDTGKTIALFRCTQMVLYAR